MFRSNARISLGLRGGKRQPLEKEVVAPEGVVSAPVQATDAPVASEQQLVYERVPKGVHTRTCIIYMYKWEYHLSVHNIDIGK